MLQSILDTEDINVVGRSTVNGAGKSYYHERNVQTFATRKKKKKKKKIISRHKNDTHIIVH